MTREGAKEYLEQLLTAYTALMCADANFDTLPFPNLKLPRILTELREEINYARRRAKEMIRELSDIRKKNGS